MYPGDQVHCVYRHSVNNIFVILKSFLLAKLLRHANSSATPWKPRSFRMSATQSLLMGKYTIGTPLAISAMLWNGVV